MVDGRYHRSPDNSPDDERKTLLGEGQFKWLVDGLNNSTAKFKVIVARLMDDKPIPVREKGPLFVVYPFDSSAELRTSTYYERSIWQLKALEAQ